MSKIVYEYSTEYLRDDYSTYTEAQKLIVFVYLQELQCKRFRKHNCYF
jgi:hypothetical protein